MPSVREKVPQVSDSCKLDSCASGLTSQSYLSMAILHMGWGIDIIGKVTPKASNGHEYILVAISYFTKWKWVEAANTDIGKSGQVH